MPIPSAWKLSQRHSPKRRIHVFTQTVNNMQKKKKKKKENYSLIQRYILLPSSTASLGFPRYRHCVQSTIRASSNNGRCGEWHLFPVNVCFLLHSRCLAPWFCTRGRGMPGMCMLLYFIKFLFVSCLGSMGAMTVRVKTCHWVLSAKEVIILQRFTRY